MPRSPTYLGDVAAAILAAAAAGVDTLDDSFPKPARRYVEAGPAVALDCEQIAVYLPNVQLARRSNTGSTSGRTIRTGGGAAMPVLPTAELVTVVAVCVPVVDVEGDSPRIPEPDEITPASLAALAVYQAAYFAVIDAAQARTLLPAGAGQASLRVEVGDLATSGPGGGLAWATFSTVVPV